MKTLFLALLVLLIPRVAVAAPDSAVCQVLASHQPRADVVHKPDDDVNANPNDLKIPEIVKVPLTIDLAKRVGSLTGEEVELNEQLGMVEIHQNGKVFYEGQDWTSSVMTLCGQSHVVKSEMAVTLDEPEAEPELEIKTEVEVGPKPEPKNEVVSEPQSIINRTKILDNEPIINRTPVGTKREAVSVKIDTGSAPALPRISKPVLSAAPAPAPIVEPAPPPVIEPVQPMLPPMEPLPPPFVEVLPEPPAPNTPLVLDKTSERVTEGVPPADIIYREENPVTGESEIIEGGDYREIYYNE